MPKVSLFTVGGLVLTAAVNDIFTAELSPIARLKAFVFTLATFPLGARNVAAQLAGAVAPLIAHTTTPELREVSRHVIQALGQACWSEPAQTEVDSTLDLNSLGTGVLNEAPQCDTGNFSDVLIHLEDQLAPKRCGHVQGKVLIPLEETVGKLHSAKDAAAEQDIVIIARTDARAVEGFQAALDRCKAFECSVALSAWPEVVRLMNYKD